MTNSPILVACRICSPLAAVFCLPESAFRTLFSTFPRYIRKNDSPALSHSTCCLLCLLGIKVEFVAMVGSYSLHWKLMEGCMNLLLALGINVGLDETSIICTGN